LRKQLEICAKFLGIIEENFMKNYSEEEFHGGILMAGINLGYNETRVKLNSAWGSITA